MGMPYLYNDILPPPRRICDSRCLFVCLSVCLLATLRKNFRTDLHEIFRECWQRAIVVAIRITDPDPYRDTGKTWLGRGMHRPGVSSSYYYHQSINQSININFFSWQLGAICHVGKVNRRRPWMAISGVTCKRS